MNDVLKVACCCIVFVMVCGQYYDAAINRYFPKKTEFITVDCSYEIKQMAAKFNVTLIDQCVVEKSDLKGKL